MAEVRRFVAALDTSPAQQRHRLHWSCFRRFHQARAKRLHALRRARQAPCLPVSLPAPVLLTGVPALTEAHWDQIARFLPAQFSPQGRRTLDYRLVVEAVLWIVRTGSSWRELPERFGAWETVAYHFYRWNKVGFWERIRAILLTEGSLPGPAP